MARYASEAIAGRMPDLGIAVAVAVPGDPGPLPADLLAFKRRVEAAGMAAADHLARRGFKVSWPRWRR